MRNFLLRYAPVTLWMVMMFIFSSRSDLPARDSLAEDFIIKKLAHVLEYFVLMFLMYRAVGEKSIAKAFLYCLIYAFSDEIHQLFIPYRTGKLRDVGIDSIGLILSVFIIIKYQLWNSSLLLSPPKPLKK